MKTVILESTFNFLQKEEKEQLIQQGEVKVIEREGQEPIKYLKIIE